MGEALIRGFCKSGVSSVEQISASVRSFDRQRALSNLGLRVYGNALEGGAADLAANSEIIFLGVSCVTVLTAQPELVQTMAPNLDFVLAKVHVFEMEKSTMKLDQAMTVSAAGQASVS